MKRATELEYLIWFRENLDYGPFGDEIIYYMNEKFKEETGKNLPKKWEDSK
jgi:hypothetical protein